MLFSAETFYFILPQWNFINSYFGKSQFFADDIPRTGLLFSNARKKINKARGILRCDGRFYQGLVLISRPRDSLSSLFWFKNYPAPPLSPCSNTTYSSLTRYHNDLVFTPFCSFCNIFCFFFCFCFYFPFFLFCHFCFKSNNSIFYLRKYSVLVVFKKDFS